jgi:hypothetical protein
MLRRISGLTGVAELDVVDAAGADGIAERVCAARKDWRRRSLRAEFYTLGGNSYMDLAGSGDGDATYFHPARDGNNRLRHRFPDVYDRLAERFELALSLGVRFPDDLALPGFHIWTGMSIPHSSGPSIHFDLQYLRILERPAYAGATGTVSFTLPVQLPHSGSALNVWPDIIYPDATGGVAAARTTPPTIIAYRAGVAVVHSGHLLHQIGATDSPAADDLRITMQGHGLVIGDELVLYW